MRAETFVDSHGHKRQVSLRELDWLMAAVVALCCLGLVIAVSVQGPGRGPLQALKGQGSKLMLGLVAFLLCSTLPLHRLRQIAWPAFLSATGLCLVAALFFRTSKGAARWIRITDSLTFQPVEIARFLMIVLVATVVADLGDDIRRFRGGFLKVMGPPLLLAGALVAQPDLGNAIFTVALAATMAIAAGVRWRYFASAGLILFAGVVWHVSRRSYAQDRLHGFLDVDPAGQVGQSLTAIASGGIFGQGLGSGWMKMGFVPEAANDFVFAVIGEELGLLGSLLVLGLYTVIGLAGYRLALATEDRFLKLLVIGFSIAICMQAAINLLVVTGLAPAKGIDLPFLSSGGTNLMFALAAVGLLGNAARAGVTARATSWRE